MGVFRKGDIVVHRDGKSGIVAVVLSTNDEKYLMEIVALSGLCKGEVFPNEKQAHFKLVYSASYRRVKDGKERLIK